MRRLPFGADSGLERVGSLAIIGLILVPLAVGGLLIWALWKPTGNLDRVTAAVVNDDAPVTVNGKTVPLGREFASALINNSGGSASAKTGTSAPTSNFTWVLTNGSDASDGLSSGSYSAVVTIPAGFSEAATSLSGPAEDAHQATINVATSPDSAFLDPALTQAVTSAATESLNQELTAQYLTNIYLGFNTINAQVGQAASGASSLASGASSVSSGAQSLATGSAALSTALQALSSGSSALSSGLDTLSSQSSALPAQTAALASGASALASTAGNASSSLNDATTSFEAVVAQICQTPGPQCTTATAALKKLQTANSGVAQFSAGAGQVAAGNQQLAAAMPGLVAGIDQSASGADGVATGTAQSASGATSLTSGATSLATAAGQVSSGATQLSESLARAVAKIPTYSSSDQQTLSAVAAAPVVAHQSTAAAGLGAVPLFSVIALWIGGLAIALARKAVPSRQLLTAVSSGSIALRSARTGALIGVAQGLVVASVAQTGLALTGAEWASFALACMLVGGVFALVNQGLAAAFGAIGRFIALLIAVVGLGAGIASTVPPALANVAALLPTAPALTLLRAAASDDVGTVWLAAGVTALFGVAGFVLIFAGTAVRRVVRARDIVSMGARAAA